MADKRRVDEPTGTEFVGHEWDGIEELNTPLPRWWLWTFYATIAFSVIYVVLYPAWPLVSNATEGTLGWSSRGELAEEISEAQLARAGTFELIAATDIDSLAGNPELMGQAIAGGAAAFKQHCVQCHGAGAAGYKEYGYPNLNDDDWLWGGELSEIEFTLTHGIRWEGSDQTRFNMMPAYGEFMSAGDLDALADHALSLSGKAKSSSKGAELFEQNCAACHMVDGSGNQELGAPALNDAIWLYGDDLAQVRQQIALPRHGVMPGWSDKLDEVTIRMLAAYIHSRGGGEATTPSETVEAEPAQAAVAEVASDERG